MRNITKKLILPITLMAVIVLNFLVWTLPCQAYTGAIGIFPPLTGGPNHKTVTNLPINTEEQNPVYQTTNLNYVESIIIETNPTIKSHILISEYPAGDSVAFSFTVPQPFQDALVYATINFWGPDVDSLQIWHDHSGVITQLTATKVQPVQRDADNNVLWSFTTTSFSDFYTDKIEKKNHDAFPTMTLIALSLMSLSAVFVLRKN